VNPDKNTIKDQQLARKLLREKPSENDKLPSLHPDTASGETVIEKTAQASAENDPASTRDTGSASLLTPLHYPKPLISQPKVLRVWVAPYHGPEGNLHFPGMVYSIITPQTWNFGHGSAHAQVPVPVS
jgi:conjugal transfer pilus assembly protein TraV